MAGMVETEDKIVNTLVINMFWMFQKVEEGIIKMKREMEHTKKGPNRTHRVAE